MAPNTWSNWEWTGIRRFRTLRMRNARQLWMGVQQVAGSDGGIRAAEVNC